MTLRKVVVVGGSIAASTAVSTLRAEGFDGVITQLSDEAVPAYTRVPLSKGVLSGALTARDAFLGADVEDVDVRLSTTAVGLDLAGRRVVSAGAEFRYDGLVIATGARARRIGGPGQREVVLRSLDDAAQLRLEVAQAASVLVVGGGVLGMEIASTCRQLGRDVTVVDLAPPMDRMLGPVAGAVLRDIACDAGVRLVESPGGLALLGALRPHGVRLSTGAELTADLVVSAVGDVPNVEWLEGSGLALAGGVVVDGHCAAAPAVVAAGDVAVVSGSTRTPQWTSSVEQGRVAALRLLHGPAGPAWRPSRFAWSDQFGITVRLVGDPGPTGAPDVIEGSLADRSALLGWSGPEGLRTVIALNHRTPVGRLKQMVPPAS